MDRVPARLVCGVSVPLRGYGFEIITLRSYTGWHALVSVPLRGYGFEIITLRGYTGWHALVSVPLRGYGFEIG